MLNNRKYIIIFLHFKIFCFQAVIGDFQMVGWAISLIQIRIAFLLACLLFLHLPFAHGASEEETYSISLTKTAEAEDEKVSQESAEERGQEAVTVQGRKVLTETHTVREGEWLWQIFRQKGLLKKGNLAELLTLLKSLNASMRNLDQVHPGQKIIIPLAIVPLGDMAPGPKELPQEPVDLASLKDLDLDNYTVKPGDSLIRVLGDHYKVPEKDLYDEYLQLVKRLNPSIRDLNLIYPGQIIKIPIYSPQVVRRPIKASPPTSKEMDQPLEGAALNRYLSHILTEMGEEWIQTGQHFIPFPSGGQVDLKADSYPIINLSNGTKVIVDLYNKLPEKMANLIKTSWKSYEIVHLEKEGLRKALDKILTVCKYSKIYRAGEPFETSGEIPVRIAADWIIQKGSDPFSDGNRVIMITLIQKSEHHTPGPIKDFLKGLGIQVIDYPEGDVSPFRPPVEADNILTVGTSDSLVEHLLNLTGQGFSRDDPISVYQGQDTGLNVVVVASFSMKVNGRRSIVDLSGLGPDMLSLLKEKNVSVLSLAGEKDLLTIVSKALRFLGIKFYSGPRSFQSTRGDASKNITFTIPGIEFRDSTGKPVLATSVTIPPGLGAFLAQMGYRILHLKGSG